MRVFALIWGTIVQHVVLISDYMLITCCACFHRYVTYISSAPRLRLQILFSQTRPRHTNILRTHTVPVRSRNTRTLREQPVLWRTFKGSVALYVFGALKRNYYRKISQTIHCLGGPHCFSAVAMPLS